MQRTILLSGANGLLGQKLTDLLASKDDLNLIATSRGSNRNPMTAGYTYESLDICDEENLRALFEQYKPTEFINSAAMTNVDLCETETTLCDQINVEAVKKIVALCEEFNCRLIQISTDFIFDGISGPYHEESEANPPSYYAASKWEAEKIVMASTCKWAIARTVLLYGVIRDLSRSNIVLWAKGALEKGAPINVVYDQERCPTLAEDLAEGVRLIVDQDQIGIWHLSGAEQLKITDLVRRIAKFWNLDDSIMTEVDSSTLNQPAKRPPITGFIIDKAVNQLDYKPHSFEEGLAVVDGQLKALV